jgi:hypothetical protein
VTADTLSIEIGAPEVDDLGNPIVVHYVFELDIAVDNMVAV